MPTPFDEATELLGRAEELHRRGRVEAATAIAIAIFERTGEPGGADEGAYGEALAELMLRLGGLFRAVGMAERAAAVLPRAVRWFERSAQYDGPAKRAAALREQGLALRDMGRLDEAEAALREALDGDLSFAEVEAIVRSLVELSDVLAALGKFSSASKAYEWATQQAMGLGDRELEAVVRHGHGELLLRAGRADIAFLRFWRAFHLFRMIGDDDGLACATRGLGDVALGGGRGGEARQAYLQMLALGQQDERPSVEALARMRRAAGFRTDGMLDEAEEELRAARAILEPLETVASELPERLHAFVPAPIDLLSMCTHETAMTLACRGAWGAAEDWAHRALQARTRRGDRELWKTCALLGRVAGAVGDRTLARVWSERAAAAFRPVPMLARAGDDVAALVDALGPMFAMAQAARRDVDPWIGEALSFGGPIAHEAELRVHLAALADAESGAPIPSAELPAALAKALRDAWKLGPWPEDDRVPDPADD